LDLFLVDSTLAMMSHTLAMVKGFTIPFNSLVFCGAHTHSGPGAWVPRVGHALGPSADFFDFNLFTSLAENIAEALLLAQRNFQPVQLALGMGDLIGVTHNRRSGISPYVNDGTIDPNVGIIRVDDLQGKPLVTLWNFAIHGICYDEYNLKFSSDIMGYANIDVEAAIGGISMFVNSDAGDINPKVAEVCVEAPNFLGSRMIAKKVLEIRDSIKGNLTTTGMIQSATISQSYAPVTPNWTLARTEGCHSGGPLDICTICAVIHCDVDTHFPESWWDATPKFTAFSFKLRNYTTLMSTIPGEAIVELGWWLRNDSIKLGFDQNFLLGYTNNYLGYLTTPREYLVGGYEAMLTLFGIDSADKIRRSVYEVSQQVVFP